MTRLLLIGNGFDLAHGLDTTYENLMKYIYDYDEKENTDTFQKINDLLLEKAGINAKPTDYQSYRDVLKPTWCELENHLQDLLLDNAIPDEINEFNNAFGVFERNFTEEQEIVSNSGQIISTDIGYYDGFAKDDYLPDEYLSLAEAFNTCLLFWVISKNQSICEAVNKRKLDSLLKNPHFLPNGFFKENDLIINFNYTNTIEQFYNFENVYHIHGTSDLNNPPIMGHTNTKYKDDGRVTPLENYVVENLYKDIEKIWNDTKKHFAGNFKHIDEVYVLGLGYTDVDYDYFKRLKEEISSDTKWYLSYYQVNEKDTDSLKKAIDYAEKLKIQSTKFETIKTDRIYTEQELYNMK